MVTGVGGEEDIYDTLQRMLAILYVDDLPEDEMADCALALHKTIGEDLYLRLWEALKKKPLYAPPLERYGRTWTSTT